MEEGLAFEGSQPDGGAEVIEKITMVAAAVVEEKIAGN